MTYHFMEDGTVLSGQEFIRRIRKNLKYLASDDPVREEQEELLRDLIEEEEKDSEN